MCKFLINEVMLGKRTVGFELYSSDTQDIIGMTEKQIKDSLLSGKSIKGFKLDNDGNVEVDRDFCKNFMVKSGIGTLSAKFETDCISNIIYTAVGKNDSGIEVVSSRFFRGVMPEDKIKILCEMGAVNGINIDAKGKVQLIDDSNTVVSVKETDNKKEDAESKVKATSKKVEVR